ncbi:MAG TPA: TerC family protein [Spirochaetota bacterium]|nr:TerC family protein [Spirochaetota bacterium]HOD13997.1 TerC family protein [Spirochaetota bacterium]HPG51872.1 TerC family protein [Spirochaetota bacterium]HPN13268.1 TerC family protein [Spirochaetota bacterium]
MSDIALWGGFILFIIAMLVLDLKVFQRKEHEIMIREALLWTLFWIVLSLGFNLGIYFYMGTDYALEFLTGYLIEKALSVDNIFVFIIIFAYFGVAPRYQHKILFWGILGAIIMRAFFILAGVALIERLHWVIYILGIFLVYIGIKLAFEKEKEVHPEQNPLLKIVKRIFPVDTNYTGSKFFTRQGGKTFATPLFIVLIAIESTDIVFAVDSIPAILSITRHPFIVFTSNIFAILGLRALYFAISGIMQLFAYLNYGLSLILVFVGVKMLIADYYKIPVSIALGTVGGILAISIILSLLFPPKDKKRK